MYGVSDAVLNSLDKAAAEGDRDGDVEGLTDAEGTKVPDTVRTFVVVVVGEAAIELDMLIDGATEVDIVALLEGEVVALLALVAVAVALIVVDTV